MNENTSTLTAASIIISLIGRGKESLGQASFDVPEIYADSNLPLFLDDRYYVGEPGGILDFFHEIGLDEPANFICDRFNHWGRLCPCLTGGVLGLTDKRGTATSGSNPGISSYVHANTSRYSKSRASQAPLACAASPGTTSAWILDSGASHHMTPDGPLLTDCSPAPTRLQVHTADGTPLRVSQCGTITPQSYPSGRFTLSPVLHISQLSMNLASVGRLTDCGFDVLFTSSSCFVQDPHSGQRIGTGRRVGGLYHLEHLHLPPSAIPSRPSCGFVFSVADLWHRRLGHISGPRLRTLFQSGVFGPVTFTPLSDCTGCRLAKQNRIFAWVRTFTHCRSDFALGAFASPLPLSS